MNKLLDSLRDIVKSFMSNLAKLLNKIFAGNLSPNHITIIALAGHVYIASLIARDSFMLAGVLLIFFGLLDSLDGALARLQKKASSAGMLLDATTDRMKEVLLYAGISYALINSDQPLIAVLAVLACGGSLIVSYVKAKGETAIKNSNLSPNEINRMFQDGLMRYEVRMSILVAGLLFNQLALAVAVIAVLSWATAIQRLISISSKL